MKKGFTLIELLAVIVILGIIAAITIPTVSEIISSSKKSSAEKSTEGFIRAVELAELNYQVETNGIISNNIEDLSLTDSEKKDVVVNSIVISESGKVTSASLFINEYNCNYSNEKAVCEKSITVSTQELLDTLIHDENSGLVADVYEPGRYYFRGLNPKNIISLQESTGSKQYRIISFEADGTIKVVREDSIGEMEWDNYENRDSSIDTFCSSDVIVTRIVSRTDDTTACNVWGSMHDTYRNNKLMNDYYSLKYYENNEDTWMVTRGSEVDPKTTVTKDSSLNEYLNSNLTTNLAPISNYIDEHMWDVGGIKVIEDGKDYEKEIAETKINQWKGYIALPSIIDYKNASDNTTQCMNVIDGGWGIEIGETIYFPCTTNSDGTVNNYLYKSEYSQWTLNAESESYGFVFYADADGSIGIWPLNYDMNMQNVRPSFYLKSTIKLTGAGTIDSKFMIIK